MFLHNHGVESRDRLAQRSCPRVGGRPLVCERGGRTGGAGVGGVHFGESGPCVRPVASEQHVLTCEPLRERVNIGPPAAVGLLWPGMAETLS